MHLTVEKITSMWQMLEKDMLAISVLLFVTTMYMILDRAVLVSRIWHKTPILLHIHGWRYCHNPLISRYTPWVHTGWILK